MTTLALGRPLPRAGEGPAAPGAWARHPTVLALTAEAEPDALTTLWRIQWPVDALELAGYPCRRVHVSPDDPATLQRLLTDAYRPDAIVFHRAWFHRWHRGLEAWVTALRRAGTALLIDTDGAVFDPRAPAHTTALARQLVPERDGQASASRAAREAAQRAAAAALQHVHGLTVSTPALAALVRALLPAGTPVTVLPNAIRTAPYAAARRAYGDLPRPRGGVTVGWAGTGREADTFAATGMAEAWRRLAARYPGVTFVVVGYAFGALAGVVPAGRLVDLGGVPFEQYPSALATVDIGCVPLLDNWWNRCRSPQKSWEFPLTGAAVVASPFLYGDPAVNGGFAESGGLLAADADQWEHHLSRLIEDAGERRERADALSSWVLAEHSLEANLHRWPAAWKALADQAGRPTTAAPPAASAGTWAAYQAQRAAQKAAAKRARKAQRGAA